MGSAASTHKYALQSANRQELLGILQATSGGVFSGFPQLYRGFPKVLSLK